MWRSLRSAAAAWLYDLLQPPVQQLLVCNPRRNALINIHVSPGEGENFFLDILSQKMTYARLDELEIRCSIRLSHAPMRAQIIVPAVEVIPNLGLQRL
jgi:hypothetical protein